MSVVKQFAKSKYDAFKSVINSEEAKQNGIMSALRKARYNIRIDGTNTHAQKGRAVISFGDNPNNAMITLIHSKNLVSWQ